MTVGMHQDEVLDLVAASLTARLLVMYVPGLLSLNGAFTAGASPFLCLPGLTKSWAVAQMLTNVFMLAKGEVSSVLGVEISRRNSDFDVSSDGYFADLETSVYSAFVVGSTQHPFVGASCPIDFGEVAVDDPFLSFLRVPSFGPTPYFAKHIVIDAVEDLATDRMAVVVGPASE